MISIGSHNSCNLSRVRGDDTYNQFAAIINDAIERIVVPCNRLTRRALLRRYFLAS